MGLIIEPGITISGVGSFTVSAPPPTPSTLTVQYLVVAGGGGNGVAPASTSGAGGDGAVIIAVPNAQYPAVNATGAAVSTPASAPGMTVLTYTSSGTYTV